MTVLDELLGCLPSDAPLRGVEQGERACAVWSRQLGLASICRTVADAAPTSSRPALVATGASARALAGESRSRDSRRAALGLAALNSLLDPRRLPLEEGSAQELLAPLCEGRRLCVVGHFPFVEALRQRARRLAVLELSPREGDLPAAAAADEIPAADLVAITGTSLVNHTLDALLELARGKPVLLLGPTTPLHPVLFEHGIWALCGSLATDPAGVLASVGAGRSFRRCPGLRQVILRREPRPAPR